MDYSIGVLNSMCTPFFPDLQEELGPFLVDKTELIEDRVAKDFLSGLKGHVDLIL